jgi:hypothetical protein
LPGTKTYSESEKLSVNMSPLCSGWYVAILIKMVIPILCAEINGHVPCPYFLPCPIINRVEIIGLISILSFDQSGFSTFFSLFLRLTGAAWLLRPIFHCHTTVQAGLSRPMDGMTLFLEGGSEVISVQKAWFTLPADTFTAETSLAETLPAESILMAGPSVYFLNIVG